MLVRGGGAMPDRVLHAAVCEACGAAFRVPSRERTYTCKKCGGVVRAVDAPEDAPAPEPEATCPACHAVFPRDTRFCPECGRDSQEVAAPAARPTAAERKLASRD